MYPMKVNGQMISMKDKESLFKIMETNIPDNLKVDYFMDKEFQNIKMVTVMKENFKMEKEAKGQFTTKMDKNIQVIFIQVYMIYE